ncbi:hypothetical protein [Arenimonas metalli]|uniref:N-acetyltransferase domain-containing protein n=1 Tax=Arenimonas metalli CF5-1 TaxID=1384056 RepID=A0A091B5Q7_9GAMM|nr:hypothetical protein [Arenimonas metalli]KFN46847.1 hypothetical protein N787_00710 [Arenimonas metalli CF5-1]
MRHLDLRWKVRGGVQVRVVEQPGLWMAPEELESLLAQLRGIVRRGIGHDLDYGIVTGDPERLRQAVITILSDAKTGEPVAFNALSYMDLELRGVPARALHLGLVVVDPAFRTQGLSWVLYGLTCMLIFVRRGLRPLWISNVTQVPAIIGKVAEAFVTAWPNPFASVRRSFDHLSVAREIMRRHRAVFGVGPEAGFDEARFVITDAYTGGSDNLKKTFDQAQKHRDERANALCRDSLDYARGDDFLQVARFDLPAARRYLLRDVPRHSLPALSFRLLFLMLGQVLLPLLHWLDPQVAMGALRPRGED